MIASQWGTRLARQTSLNRFSLCKSQSSRRKFCIASCLCKTIVLGLRQQDAAPSICWLYVHIHDNRECTSPHRASSWEKKLVTKLLLLLEWEVGWVQVCLTDNTGLFVQVETVITIMDPIQLSQRSLNNLQQVNLHQVFSLPGQASHQSEHIACNPSPRRMQATVLKALTPQEWDLWRKDSKVECRERMLWRGNY